VPIRQLRRLNPSKAQRTAGQCRGSRLEFVGGPGRRRGLGSGSGPYSVSVSSLALIAWPYHAGIADVSMGLGPTVLAADERLRHTVERQVEEVTVERILPVEESLAEVARIFELDRRLARSVAAAHGQGQFPLVLAGNCISCLGTTAGVRNDRDLGVIWLDAHADFDTPEDNLSGFTDVMALSILTGGCWRALRETIPGFGAIDESNVVLIGTRDLEPYQRDRLNASYVRAIAGAVDAEELRRALEDLHGRVEEVYLHVDLDVLDTSVGHANAYAAAGGPDLKTVLRAVEETFARFTVKAAALTAYDPQVDNKGSIADAAREIGGEIARGAAEQLRQTDQNARRDLG
jgi:arginase